MLDVYHHSQLASNQCLFIDSSTDSYETNCPAASSLTLTLAKISARIASAKAAFYFLCIFVTSFQLRGNAKNFVVNSAGTIHVNCAVAVCT